MLTKLEVLNITETIDKAEISFSHLRDDLIDHVCCEIENLMERGFNFNEAFENIKPQIGIRDLEKVQENTLLLIDKKYRIMKKLMSISGILSLIGLITGTLLRIYHLPGANIVLAIGFFCLCLLFLPVSIFIMQKENKSSSQILLYTSAYIGSIGFSLGVFFKVMHWPATGIILTIGILFISLVFMPALWFHLKNKTQSSLEKFAVFAGIFGGSLHFIAVLLKIQHWSGSGIAFFISIIALVLIFLPVYSYIHFKDAQFIKGKFIYLIYSFTFFILLTLLLQLRFIFDIVKPFNVEFTSDFNVIKYYDHKDLKTIVIKNSTDKKVYDDILNKISETSDLTDSIGKVFIHNLAPNINYNENNTKEIYEILFNSNDPEIFETIIFNSDHNNPAARIKKNLSGILSKCDQLGFQSNKMCIIKTLLNTEGSYNDSNTWENSMFRNKRPIIQYLSLIGIKEKLLLARQEIITGNEVLYK